MKGEDSCCWFRLFSTPGFGPARIHRLHARARMNGVSITEIFRLSQREFERVFAPRGAEIFQALRQVEENEIQSRFQALIAGGTEIIHPEHPLYPRRLFSLYMDAAPALLFAKGALRLLKSPHMAAVAGSRDADETVLKEAGKIAGAAVECGYSVVSGFARGVDTAAHIGALEAGGTTVMVLACGIDRFQPKTALLEVLDEERCLLLSQFHPDESWKNSHGIIRNRSIVGLSDVVIVVQAEADSGSAHTGRTALKAGIPLLVLSGRFFDVPPSGNLELIAGGAEEISGAVEAAGRLKNLRERDGCPPWRGSDSQQNKLDINH